jgi:hypothetical protein
MKTITALMILIMWALFFMTGCDSVTDSKSVPVSRPTLVAPVDNGTGISLTPTFTWESAADKLEIASNNAFTTILYSSAVSGNSFTLAAGVLQANTTYYWRVGSSSGSSMVWSNYVFSFTTGQ